jgi:exodeoxyribonuclease V alpha subunit
LPEHETVFAMTVHKTQGSEFGKVLLLLPERPSPIVNRALVYTAVTRARSEVLLYGSPALLRTACGSGGRNEESASSGLLDALKERQGAGVLPLFSTVVAEESSP